MIQYQIDPQHTAVHFKVRHMMISYVRGDFGGISGSVAFDPRDLSGSRVIATIDASTVNTREPARDKHLRSADFLDVRRYPLIEFASTKIEPRGEKNYDMTGNLTIREATREVVLHVSSLTDEIKDLDGRYRRGATAEALLRRKDFGLTWDTVLESGGFLVGDDIEITIDVELIRLD